MLAGWSVRRLTINVDARCYEIETADGVVHRQQMPDRGGPTLEMARDFRRVSWPITDEGVAFDSDTATGMMPAAQRVVGVLTSWRS